MVLDNLSLEDYLEKAHFEVEWHFDQKHWAEQNVFEAVAEFASLDLEVVQTKVALEVSEQKVEIVGLVEVL